MPGLKKIDYRKLDKEPVEAPPPTDPQGAIPTAPIEPQQPEENEKISFFGSFQNRWSLMGRKEKIETFVLIIVIACIIVVAVYHFSNKRPKYIPEKAEFSPAIENWQEEQ